METKREQLNTAVMVAGFNAIAGKLDEINEKVTREKATLPVVEALRLFRAKIEADNKAPRNFKSLLNKFQDRFLDGDIAVINAHELSNFLDEHWSGAKKSTYNAMRARLSALMSFSIKEMQKRGLPKIYNPIELIDSKKGVALKENVFVGEENMRKLLYQCDNDKHWLFIGLMLLSGLRSGEVLKLKPEDISGRTLTLIEPKSGKPFELAVTPSQIITELKLYINRHNIKPDEKIFNGTHGTSINKVVRRVSAEINMSLCAHDLRKQNSSFWSRLGLPDAVRFVLRHSSGPDMTVLQGRYLAPLSCKEMCALQDEFLAPIIFGD